MSTLEQWARRKAGAPRFAKREGLVPVEITVTNSKGTTFKKTVMKRPEEAKKMVAEGKAERPSLPPPPRGKAPESHPKAGHPLFASISEALKSSKGHADLDRRLAPLRRSATKGLSRQENKAGEAYHDQEAAKARAKFLSFADPESPEAQGFKLEQRTHAALSQAHRMALARP